nr:MAG TPA: hypothetical protein [Caudoviricetes sp.]
MTLEELSLNWRQTEDRSLRNEGRIKKLETDQKALMELAASVRELAADQANMKKDIGEIKDDVRALTDKPAKRWDNLVDKIVWAIAAAVVAYLLAGAGL